MLVKNEVLRVLLVEDNSSDARLLREMFSKEKQGSFELTHVTHMREAEIRLSKGDVDIVLLDMGLPDGHGIDIHEQPAQRPLSCCDDCVDGPRGRSRGSRGYAGRARRII